MQSAVWVTFCLGFDVFKMQKKKGKYKSDALLILLGPVLTWSNFNPNLDQ